MVEPDSRELSRSDLALARQALRQDWPVPPGVKARILQRLIDYLDREHEEGRTAPDRTVIMVARTLHSFMKLNIDQQKLDLIERKLDGGHSVQSLIDLVENAEKLALDRLSENTTDPNPGRLL